MVKKEYELAQLNVGLTVANMDDPIMAEFSNNLDNINALAEATPGYVWRLQTEEGNATDIKVYESDLAIVNLSVWKNKEALFDFVYKSNHKDFVRQRRKWFEKWDGPHMALWWVEKGVRPTPLEAKERLEHLAEHGPTPHAFNFRTTYSAPDE
jgi:hypothetical protein